MYTSLPMPIVQTGKVRVVTTTVPTTPSSAIILPANPARIGFYIYNNSANSIYISFAPTSSGSTPTIILATFAEKFMIGPVVYTGDISATRNSGSGPATVYELLSP